MGIEIGGFDGAYERAHFSQPSPFGASYRQATDLLMSIYDTNPAATDHTTVFTAALTAASALITSGYAKVRIILDTRQKYTLGGAVQSGANGQYAQVPLPHHDDTATGTIELVGIPRGNDYTYISAGASGTVIESTLAAAPAFSATNGIASIFGGPASFRTTPGAYPSEFSYLKFATQDITIRSANPVVCGIDAGWVTGFSWQGLLAFDTDYFASQGINYQGFTPCTNPQAIPIIFPFNLDWFGTCGDTLVCAGWAHGPYLGEFAHIRRAIVFGVPGGCLLLDGANQPTRIDYLADWNNAHGVGTLDGLFTGITPVSPGSGVQTGTAPGSRRTLSASFPASPVDIGTWEMQLSQGGGFPASTQRVYDVMDANALVILDCSSWVQTHDDGTVNVNNLTVLGNGPSTSGYVIGTRCKNKMVPFGPSFQVVPVASGVSWRNPYGRDCLVWVENANGATITAVDVQGATGVTTSTGTYPFMVPAQAIVSVTWTGGTAPTLTWQAI